MPLDRPTVRMMWMKRCRDVIMSEMRGRSKRGRDAVLKKALESDRSLSPLSLQSHQLFKDLVLMYPEINNTDAGAHPECPPIIIGHSLNDHVRIRHRCLMKIFGLTCDRASCKSADVRNV